MKAFFCRLFGHRWQFSGDPSVLQPPANYHCKRCGMHLPDWFKDRL
jgi:hypothetical protein